MSMCTSKMSRRPLRSKYSKVSKQLIARYDHYCPWVNNTIGSGNHADFVKYLLLLVVNGAWSAWAITQFWSSPSGCNIQWENYQTTILKCSSCSLWITYIFLIDVGVCIWIVFGVLGEQFRNILKGITTNELYHAKRYTVRLNIP